MPQLTASNLAKRYKGREVVVDVSLSVKSGEVVGLLGPNGAGKTTCFYMIAGLIKPLRGKVFIDDKDITQYAMHDRAKAGIGYLPQEASVFRKLSVANNILAVLETRKGLNRKQRIHKKDELLREFNITHLKRNLGMALSGGERRRVEIARALAADPDFILLDEPFAGVDPISVSDIKNIIAHLKNRGIGVLITDHNVRETLDICERAYIVSEGQIIEAGNAEAVLNNSTVQKIYLGENFRL